MGFPADIDIFCLCSIVVEKSLFFQRRSAMKKKVLVVSQKGTLVSFAVIRKDAEIIEVSHLGALAVFTEEVPSIIVVDDYTESGSLALGFQTYHEIKERLLPWQRLVRMGTRKYAHADYIRHPDAGEEANRFFKTVESLIAA